MPCIQSVLIDSSQYVRKRTSYISQCRRWDNSVAIMLKKMTDQRLEKFERRNTSIVNRNA